MEMNMLSTTSMTVGVKQTVKAVKRNEVEEVLLAHDCDECMAMEMLEVCLEYGIPVNRTYTMQELGELGCIKVKSAALGILK